MQNNLYKIGKGSYLNEPDYYLKNWQEAFWGPSKRYDRLLRAKQRFDPNNIFSCHQCVGAPANENKLQCGEMPHEDCAMAAGSSLNIYNVMRTTFVMFSVVAMNVLF